MQRRDLGGPGGRVHGRAARISSLPLPIRNSRGENRRGAPPRRGRGRGLELDSARMAGRAAAAVASSRLPFFRFRALFVRNNSPRMGAEHVFLAASVLLEGRRRRLFFLGPKGKFVGLGCQTRLLFSLCDWARVGTSHV